MVRREKSDVLPELPDKRYKTIPLKLRGEQKRLYRSMEEDMFARLENGKLLKAGTDLTKLIRLKQICLTPDIVGSSNVRGTKTEAILDTINNTDKKICIFSTSKQYINYLINLVDDRYVVITGDVDNKDRRKAEKAFQENPDVKLFFGTIQIAEGLNLQSSSILIFADKSWVPEQNKQVEDRIHRIGQNNKPLIINFVFQNTIEEDLEETLSEKQSTIDEATCIENTIKRLEKRLKNA